MKKIIVIILIPIVLLFTACQEQQDGFNGYVDADLVYLSANFSGRLASLQVNRGQAVQKNQFLFSLEEQNELYNVDIGKWSTADLYAQRAQLMSRLDYATTQYRRVKRMQRQHAASQEALDGAERDLSVLKKQLAELNAKIKSSKVDTSERQWRVQRKKGYAISDGIVFDTYYTEGEYVQAGFPVLSLITPQHIKVVFFVPEEQLSKIALGEAISISADSSPHMARGKINYISEIAEFTPPIIFSREERSRLVFRVEATINAADLKKIHLGQPVTLKLVS